MEDLFWIAVSVLASVGAGTIIWFLFKWIGDLLDWMTHWRGY